jgi:hypothetical protein
MKMGELLWVALCISIISRLYKKQRINKFREIIENNVRHLNLYHMLTTISSSRKVIRSQCMIIFRKRTQTLPVAMKESGKG